MSRVAKIAIGASVGGVLFLIFVGLLASSFSVLEYYQYGLDYNGATATVDTATTYTAGRYALGVGHSFVVFPRTLETIEFSSSFGADDGPLLTRSQDGVALTIAVSFQYRIVSTELGAMYTEQGRAYEQNIVRVARFAVRDVAGNYTAVEFFQKRSQIGADMFTLLSSNLRGLHFELVYFQLRDVQLPTVFESAIEAAEVARQNIQITTFQQQAATVRQATQVLLAGTNATVQVTRANAAAQAFLLEVQATSEALKVRQAAQATAYRDLMASLGFNATDLLSFLWTQAIQAHNPAKLVLGMSQPAATQIA